MWYKLYMRFDTYSQTLITQLNWLYKVSEVFIVDGKYEMEPCANDINKPYLYDLIYDQLIKEGFEIIFTPEQKNKMWTLANKCFIREEKRNPKAEDEVLLHKYYKSYLAKYYVLGRLPERMRVHNEETGEEIKEMRFVIKGVLSK